MNLFDNLKINQKLKKHFKNVLKFEVFEKENKTIFITNKNEILLYDSKLHSLKTINIEKKISNYVYSESERALFFIEDAKYVRKIQLTNNTTEIYNFDCIILDFGIS